MEWIPVPRVEDPGGFWRDIPGMLGWLAQPVLLGIVLVALVSALVWWIRRDRRPWVVVDGSNVMHWIDDVPQIQTLVLVLAGVQQAGYRPIVWFDANAGYKLGGRYMSDGALAQQLALPRGQVRVAPKGTPADPLLLRDAQRLRATVVSNDRFRDWQASFPEILPDARMMRGRVVNGALHLHVM